MKFSTYICLVVFFCSCGIGTLIGPKKDANYYYEHGKTAVLQTDAYLGIKNFSKAIAIDPKFIQAYLSRAQAYQSVDSLDRAIADYDSLLNMNLQSQQQKAEIYYLQAGCYYLNSQDSMACKRWRNARDLNHSDSWNKIRKFCK